MTESDTELTQLRNGNSDTSRPSDEMESTELTCIGLIQKRFGDLKRFKTESPGCLGAIVVLSVLLMISVCVNIVISCKENQSCIYDESCQNINNLHMHRVQDDNNCSGKQTNTNTRNIGMIFKLGLWEDVLNISLQLQTNFVLRHILYDKIEIGLCRKDRNHFYISCDKPFNDNCTVIHESEDTTSITAIQKTGDRMVTYEIPTKCIDRRAVLEWIQPQMLEYKPNKPKT